ncbi:hypothetical protein BDW67DRAFT_118381 [Aspergillus spinulosporus]
MPAQPTHFGMIPARSERILSTCWMIGGLGLCSSHQKPIICCRLRSSSSIPQTPSLFLSSILPMISVFELISHAITTSALLSEVSAMHMAPVSLWAAKRGPRPGSTPVAGHTQYSIYRTWFNHPQERGIMQDLVPVRDSRRYSACGFPTPR